MHTLYMQEQTSIRVSTNLLNALKKFKESNESYEDVIWDFIEPFLELSDEAKKNIEESRGQYKRGEFFTLEEVEKELGL